jgi:hypothetical protein
MLLTSRLSPDCWLEWRNQLFPLCTGWVQKCSVLESQMRQASRQGPGGKPVIALDSTQLASLQRVVGPSLPSPLSIERFLAALSGTALEHCSGAQIDTNLAPPFWRLPEWRA